MPLGVLCTAMTIATGCASQSNLSIDATGGPPQAKPTGMSTGYVLTDADRELDCKVIRGRMKVAIFHLQSHRDMPSSTVLSRNMQSAAAGIFGGTTYGTNPQAIVDKETARLKAYNSLLKDQDCATFDLQKELAPTITG